MTSHKIAALIFGAAAVLLPPALLAQPADLPPSLPVSGGDVIVSKPSAAPAAAASVADELVISELPPAHKTSPETRIDQRRVGNRVIEITVTPAGSTRSYTVQNREGQRPLSVHELSSGLSVPNFFRLEF